MAQAQWYVIHTYSGYENKVATSIEKIVELRGLQDVICDVRIPTQIEQEIKDSGEVVEVERKLFPGYVLVNMVVNDDTWMIIKGIRGVTGFVGPEGKPVALSETEVQALNFTREVAKAPFAAGDSVKVCSGPMANFTGVVEDVDMTSRKARVMISMGGRGIPTELDIDQIQLI